MIFTQNENTLIAKSGHETIQIEAWGNNALRIRATKYPRFTDHSWALMSLENTDSKAEVVITDAFASIQNGKAKAVINQAGVLSVYNQENRVIHEFRRNYDGSETEQCIALKINPRDFQAVTGGDYRITVRFESDPKEKFFGMGQYQEPYMDLKGCILEMGQRNSQVSIPFALSDKNYGLLWNNPGIGKAVFGKNYTEFTSESSKEIDYWVTCDDSPKKIIENFTAVT